MLSYFRSIHWKLTLSYAFVTAAAVVFIAALLVGTALVAESLNTSRTHDSFFWSKTAFQDNIPDLIDDPKALGNWLRRIEADGFTQADFTSYTVRESLSYANTFVREAPIYVLDRQLNLVAATRSDATAIGRPFDLSEIGGYSIDGILAAALVGDKNYYAQSLPLPDGQWLSAFPLRRDKDAPISAIVVYRHQPVTFITRANLEIYRLFVTGTAALMLLVSLPLGIVFGWIASRGLRRRLVTLSRAATAWSGGDFSVMPQDRSGDEIGRLTRNLTGMAGQLQSQLQARDELARIEERNRLARELHDTVKQQTYAARMQLSAARNLLKSDPLAAATHLDAAIQLNRETQQELMQIIDELRPTALEGISLAQAIVDYAARWQERTRIKITTSIGANHDRLLPADVQRTLYRILQESLSNVARHAGAESVSISLEQTAHSVTLTVADDGSGFDPTTARDDKLGLIGMKQRLAEVNGTLRVDSRPRAGTTIIAEVQLGTDG